MSPLRLAPRLSNCRKHFSPSSEIFRCFGQSVNSRCGAAQKSKAMTDNSRVLDRDRSNRVKKKRSLAASLGTEKRSKKLCDWSADLTSSSQRVSDTEGARSRERARTRKLTFQVSRNPFRRVSAARRGTLTTKEGGREGGRQGKRTLTPFFRSWRLRRRRRRRWPRQPQR